jgi:hypothetical protein
MAFFLPFLAIAQGVMAKKQHSANAAALEQNALTALEYREYERKVKENNAALINASSKKAQDHQNLINASKLGGVIANMGASGIQITGTYMDLLGQEVMLGENKVAMINSEGLRKEAGARTAGNLAMWQQEVAHHQYLQQARTQRQMGRAAMLGGIINAGISAYTTGAFGSTGATGATAMSGEYINPFTGNSGSNLLTFN